MEKKINLAEQLTPEAVKEMPKASVVWLEMLMREDNGIMWHHVFPMMICKAGGDGVLIGGTKELVFKYTIDEIAGDPDLIIWNQEPDEEQLRAHGISEEEFNTLPAWLTDYDIEKLSIISDEMTDKEFNLLMQIVDLCSDRPDRQQYARNYTGKMTDLPAALAQI